MAHGQQQQQKKENYELRCVYPSLPKVMRGKFLNLGGDPKKENFLYYNGNNVYIRDIENCSKCDIYYEHAAPVSVAKYAPSRFYIASGDESGKVRIWDTTNETHILKNEFPVLGKVVKDISWSPDSQRLCIVGDGNNSYCQAILADSGNTVGQMAGHTKSVNAAAYRPSRPYRIVTASEDFSARFYEGPPFKPKKTLDCHTNFVNCVKYSPNGEVFITGGADGKAVVFEGKDGEMIGELGGDKAHQGGIYALDFSDDGSEVLTVSGDKTAKIWNVASRELVVDFKFGNDVLDMFVGCLWQGDNILAVALTGYIMYLDRNNPSTPRKVLKGHYKQISSMALTHDCSNIYTAGSDGQIYGWDTANGMCELIKGKGHANQVSDMVIVADTLITVGMDDVLRETQLEGIGKNQYRGNACKLPSQPKALAARPGGISVVACINHIAVVENSHLMFEQAVKFEPSCVDIHPDGTTVVFGANSAKDILVYDLDGTSLVNQRKHNIGDTVSAVKFSPDGQFLVVTGSNDKRVILLDCSSDFKEVYKLGKQTGKIFSISWNPNCQFYATGSLDGSVVVWRLDKKYDANVVVYIKNAHLKSQVTRVAWLNERTLISTGNDANIKHWEVDL